MIKSYQYNHVCLRLCSAQRLQDLQYAFHGLLGILRQTVVIPNLQYNYLNTSILFTHDPPMQIF